MKRSSIESLKHNARLDVRLPDQLKDEFLARCRKEGVSGGAVIRSMIIDYLTARPRRWPAMAAGLKETIVKRSKWIAGLSGGGAAAGLAATSVLVAPAAGAEDYALNFDVQLREVHAHETRSNRIESTVRLASGEPVRFEFPRPHRGEPAQFAVELVAGPCQASVRSCPANGLDIRMEIIRLEDNMVLSSPQVIVEAGQRARMEVGENPGRLIKVSLRAEEIID